MENRPDVLAGKYDPKLFDDSGKTLLVNEIFYSLQGEGFWTGHPTVFIRLAKCNLACKFCDTEFETYEKMSVEDIVVKVLGLVPAWEGKAGKRPRIDLTGGEPMLQNFYPLLTELQRHMFPVGIETSGSVWRVEATKLDWITVSPKVRKIDMHPDLRSHANEFKWVLNAAFLLMYERDPMSVYMPGQMNYLQPESNNPKFVVAATKLILRHPDRYALSLQTHKFANNP